MAENMVEATKALGIPIVNDQADGNNVGGYFCPHNLDPIDRSRFSAEEAYFDSVTSRPNYHLISGQQATRIVVRRFNGTAKVEGVEVLRDT